MVNSIIGRTIKELRVMSFYINLNLICEIIAIYVKFDTEEWYKFTSSDGTNILELLAEEPVVLALEDIKDEFAYPIKIIDLNCSDMRIEDIKQYRYENTIELNGFFIKLNNGSELSFFCEDDCLKITDKTIIDDN